MRQSHNPNRAEDRNRILDQGFKSQTWRSSTKPQRPVGTACVPVHEALPTVVTGNAEHISHGDALAQITASHVGKMAMLDNIRAMMARSGNGPQTA